jgi:hypothetical protein
MYNNKKKQVRSRPNKKKGGAKQQATPFGDVGSILGNAIGSMFNMKLGGAGRWLGTGIGSIFGSGDYTMMGPSPKTNVLVNDAQIPKFSTTHATNVVSHREYIGDVTGTTAFTNRSFDINPSNAELFPWLSSIAGSYQQYKLHGMIVEFRPLITDFVTGGAPGVIIMATNYDVNDVAYTTKQQMENSEFAVSVKPTMNLIHGIECDPQQSTVPLKYVSTDSPNLDKPFYNWGKLQIGTQGNPNQLLGELWVSYVVEFFKPEIPRAVGGLDQFTAIRGAVSAANPLGLVPITTGGALEVTVSSTGFEFPTPPGSKWMIQIMWFGTSDVRTRPSTSITGITGLELFSSPVGPLARASTFDAGYGIATDRLIYADAFVADAATAVNCVVALAGDGVLPNTTSVQVIVTNLDRALA